MTDHTAPLATVLREQRQDRSEGGDLADFVKFRPGLSLHADPALRIGGHWRSPAGRLLELEIACPGTGQWIALHIALNAADLTAAAWIGFACRSAGLNDLMIRPCLRSGTDDGFTDCFFDKHILATAEPQAHVDALHVASHRTIPETAPWRELVLFLPRQDCRWHLHDLRPFLL